MPEKLTQQQQKAVNTEVKKQLKKVEKEHHKVVDKEVKQQIKKAEKVHQKEIDREVKQQIIKSEKVLEKKLETKLHKRLLRKSKAMTAATAKRGLRTTVFIGHKFRDHASTAMIAAFSFLIALAWKDFIVKLVRDNTKISLLEKYPYIAEFYTAIIITIIAIIGIILVSKWVKKEEKK